MKQGVMLAGIAIWVACATGTFAQGLPGGSVVPNGLSGPAGGTTPAPGLALPGQALPGQPVRGLEEPILPRPFPELPPDHAQFLDKLLAAWETQSGKIERYRCQFERWEYDPIFGPRDPREAKTYATGKIQYAKPDKGLFRIETVKAQLPPEKPGEPMQWVDQTTQGTEHWVCDGAKIYEFNHREKQLIERVLPQELQGKSIVDGPLPFFFGAEAEKVKARFWLRLVTPNDLADKEFWLEAVPKYRSDTLNFKMVHVIIDRQEFLIQAMQLFDPAYDPQKNAKRTVFTFKQREVNFNQGIQIFFGQFYKPTTPLGWKFISEPYIPEQAMLALPQQPTRPAPVPEKPGAAALKLVPFQRK